MTTPAKQSHTTGDVARICRVSIRTVHKWLDNGRLPGHLVPGSTHRRVYREDLRAFMEEYDQPLEWLDEPVS